MKIFFATDIHGSEICWRKFLNSAAFYKADMVVLGGDVTGKVMVPIVDRPGYWEVTFGGQRIGWRPRPKLDKIQRKIRDRGSYPAVMTPDELDALNEEDGSVDRRFTLEMTRGLDRWLDMADGKLRGGEIPCILNGGNDDIWEIDDIIEQSPCVSFAEGKVLDLGGFYLASMGWTNPTPWNTFREAPEDVHIDQDRRGGLARSRTWAGRCSTSTPRRTAPGWTRRPRWTRACGRRTAAR